MRLTICIPDTLGAFTFWACFSPFQNSHVTKDLETEQASQNKDSDVFVLLYINPISMSWRWGSLAEDGSLDDSAVLRLDLFCR